jgi:hypothetical protein
MKEFTIQAFCVAISLSASSICLAAPTTSERTTPVVKSNSAVAVNCNITKPSEVLRYDYQYDFTNTFYNPDDYEKYLLEFTPTFIEEYDYNLGENPVFDWTSDVKSTRFIVSPKTNPKFITSTSKYQIRAVPHVRSSNNLFVAYSINYEYESYAGSKVWRNKTYIACQPYEVSWCGDGVLDKAYGESCDDGGQNGKTGKCSLSCSSAALNTTNSN